MLTISQLARYGGTTVRAVRHYHQIGLLPEPERNRSGYRMYDAAAVVRLIRIRTLAEAGVPLARVEELLDAVPEEFARRVEQIDRELRAEIRRLQEHRRRIAGLAAGDSLALPQSVVGYLDRLRDLGVAERYIELERDAWIMVAARLPDQIDAVIAKKHEELDDPDMVRLYLLLNEAIGWSADDPRVVEIVDVLERLMLRAFEAGEVGMDELDQPFVDLMDATVVESTPAAGRVIELLEERGWKGWTLIERVQ
ncbi:helix-turn-helix domain-containing protein [Conexibacter woesei]|uniref:Transcriptional regulator, MerR family n=1 Tax=Conexibacter woesei (strain DSM 14684 / CCUG 47730 / CIP 108061 / JCM 11494 / NBRC 100937 / ID131577) TaxID=469383 RepID=D3F8A8_CONWI|nr:MerR family transcriptional regulator [Conexibacter woesei]ADB48978.1 transcriptional regulator, MerR family [Conexibacter woesei DSM 14684]